VTILLWVTITTSYYSYNKLCLFWRGVKETSFFVVVKYEKER